jgi:hypothetical protein
MKTMHDMIASNRVQFETERALRKLIKKAGDTRQLGQLERRIDRHYRNGTLSANGLGRLDQLIMERMV